MDTELFQRLRQERDEAVSRAAEVEEQLAAAAAAAAAVVAEPVIEEILDFWFGSAAATDGAEDGGGGGGSSDGGYEGLGLKQRFSRLWFAPDSSALQQAADRTVLVRFGPLLTQAAAGELAGWQAAGGRPLLALIILVDQFARHVSPAARQQPRGLASPLRNGLASPLRNGLAHVWHTAQIHRRRPDRLVLLEPTDRLARACAEQLLAAGPGWAGRLSLPERIFGLMPLRHGGPSAAELRHVLAEAEVHTPTRTRHRHYIVRCGSRLPIALSWTRKCLAARAGVAD